MSKLNKKRHAKKKKRTAKVSPIKNTSPASTNMSSPTASELPHEDDEAKLERGSRHQLDEPTSGLAPYDEALLDVCRSRWQFADWQSLASVDISHVTHHPQRDKIALLIAAAHWQLGQTQQAQRFTQAALDAGASQRQVAQLLVSGIHQSLAGGRELLGDTQAAYDHCVEAIRTGGVPGDRELLAKVRMERMQFNKLREEQW